MKSSVKSLYSGMWFAVIGYNCFCASTSLDAPAFQIVELGSLISLDKGGFVTGSGFQCQDPFFGFFTGMGFIPDRNCSTVSTIVFKYGKDILFS